MVDPNSLNHGQDSLASGPGDLTGPEWQPPGQELTLGAQAPAHRVKGRVFKTELAAMAALLRTARPIQ